MIRKFRHKLAEWKLSDIATFLALAGAVATYGISAYKDRLLKEREYADQVRAAATQLLAHIQGIQSATVLASLGIEERIVEAKVKLLKEYEPQREMHMLWGSLVREESKALERLAELQRDKNYLAFFRYQVATRACIDQAAIQVRGVLRAGFAKLRSEVESVRVDRAVLPESAKGYVPAKLYNRLAPLVSGLNEGLNREFVDAFDPSIKHLSGLLARKDTDLAAERLQSENVMCR